ncbi:MAG: Co2+/Mg2+ efflux protein ApaG [Gammaproteobacteria bacterium]|nr:Co2+/Mg2+ efflux protein ApaG [Gammaproteobacteria bacterium]
MSNEREITVGAESHYLEKQSDPSNNQFAFSYTITLTNSGQVAAQLRTRRWLITDGNDQVEEVIGEGVVGEFPYLKPGESYQYSSGAMLDTPTGTMEGSYQMMTDSGDEFEASIPMFALIKPDQLH